jgi:MFS superfamily sulfate permease-like transporter
VTPRNQHETHLDPDPFLSTGFPTFAELFTPKLVTVFREGYTFATFRADLMAGLTIAIVALPLSMAIAIGSHATPAQGLYTSIVGGFVVSLLSGSRFQIGGPAGPFIVLVAATVQEHHPDIARSALDNYEPAEPLSVGALTAGGLAALWGWAATRLIAWPFSRRSRLRVARP